MHEYVVKVNWEPQAEPYKRMGTLSSEGLPSLTVVTPPQFKFGIPNNWSPEHLFTASVSVCLWATFLAVAQASKLEIGPCHVETTGTLDDVDVGGQKQTQITKIHHKFHVNLKNPAEIDKAKKILEKSERNCIIANSMKAKVSAELIPG